MNNEIKSKWVAALRSGEYAQGTGHLNHEGKFCCLGVLCDIYSKETGAEWKPDVHSDDKTVMSMFGSTGVLPEDVMTWAELPGLNPEVTHVNLGQKLINSVAVLNDTGTSFVDIASLIEAQL